LLGIISWAGAVGSGATLVNRERERRAFHAGSYWDLKSTLEQERHRLQPDWSNWEELDWLGSDFDPTTGRIIAGRNVVLLSEAEARTLEERLTGKTWTVTDIEERPVTRKPATVYHINSATGS